MHNLREKKQADWVVFEQDIADYIDGKRQDGSGCSPIAYKKGDVKNEDYLVECKFTSKDCYTLSGETWEKIVVEATSSFRIPLFACRSKAGDYLIGSTLDFDVPDDCKEFKDTKRLKVDREMTGSLIGAEGLGSVRHQIVCWKIAV